jgi:GT2 family glycosyltransferase
VSATPTAAAPAELGVVAIGRNEGERLRRCCASLRALAGRVVYVDSGSTDGSVAMVRALGMEVVELDMRQPFTAARARNEGLRRLLELAPGVSYVQFLDGDCEVAPRWLETAAAWLDGHPDAAVVCGRRRERNRARSVYNMLCDIEWDTPVGETKACGGDAMMRVAAFRAVDGYRADLIAGEEPELCVRLREAGWKVWRIDAEMTLHDAAMVRFGQWWKRALRAGYAYAQAAALHGAPPERQGVRESRSIWFWAAALPAATLFAVAAAGPAGLALLALYPLQVARIATRGPRAAAESWWYASFLVLGKFPECLGQVKYHAERLSGGRPTLIEYK